MKGTFVMDERTYGVVGVDDKYTEVKN